MNCIEADNEIHMIPDRLLILEEKIETLRQSISLLHDIARKYDPKFDEDGIL
jgi:hypothetical protein